MTGLRSARRSCTSGWAASTAPHQAAYLDDLARSGNTDWGVMGVGLHSRAIGEVLAAQDRLYLLVERGPETDRTRVIGALTGTSYRIDPHSGEFDAEDEDVQADLFSPGRPSTAFGFLVEALRPGGGAATSPGVGAPAVHRPVLRQHAAQRRGPADRGGVLRPAAGRGAGPVDRAARRLPQQHGRPDHPHHRLSNPRMSDQLARLGRRGSSKIPIYLLPSVREAIEQQRPHQLLCLAVAGWLRFLRGADYAGEEIPVEGPRTDLVPVAREAGTDSTRLLSEQPVFDHVGRDPRFAEPVQRALEALERERPREVIQRYLAAAAGVTP
jgi:mannitol-1-phosphate/altronate dehydrogenase